MSGMLKEYLKKVKKKSSLKGLQDEVDVLELDTSEANSDDLPFNDESYIEFDDVDDEIKKVEEFVPTDINILQENMKHLSLLQEQMLIITETLNTLTDKITDLSIVTLKLSKNETTNKTDV